MPVRVVIVGAGPGGAATAIALARRGVRDVLLLDRARFPRDKTCGSGLSPMALDALDELGVGGDVRRLGYGIHSLLLTTPGGRRVRVCGGEAAVILLRKELDQLLAERAGALGVTFRDGVEVTSLISERGRVVGVRCGTAEIRADYVVCADGAHSRFSVDRRPKQALATIMGWWENVEFAPGTLEMIFDRELLPMYGWLFPETPSRVNIGITIDGERVGASRELGGLRPVFDRFLERHYDVRLRRARPVGRWHGHPISYATWMRRGGAPGVLYVGESARLTNLATGEGIYQAMRSGLLAADALRSVIVDGARESAEWRRYDWRCRRTFTPGFLAGHVFRGAVRTGVLDGLASGFGVPRIRRFATWAIGSALTGVSTQGAGVDAGADPVQ